MHSHAVKKRLPHFSIRTVQEMGWSGVKNGELLKLADQQFDVFITTDKISDTNRISLA